MKFARTALVTSLTCLAASCGSPADQANLDSTRKPTIANLMTVNLTDLQLAPSVPAQGAKSALLTVNFNRKDVTIFIPTCPEGALCIWSGPSYSAALKSDITDGCGIRTITASTDRRPVDGALTEITIKDTSKNRCDHEPLYPIITAKLVTSIVNRQTGEAGRSESILKANKPFSHAR